MNCAYHPERDPVGACVSCGRLICAECKTVLAERIYCNPCADKIILGEAETRVSAPETQRAPAGRTEEQQAIDVVQEMVTQRLLEGKDKKKIVEELVKGG